MQDFDGFVVEEQVILRHEKRLGWPSANREPCWTTRPTDAVEQVFVRHDRRADIHTADRGGVAAGERVARLTECHVAADVIEVGARVDDVANGPHRSTAHGGENVYPRTLASGVD